MKFLIEGDIVVGIGSGDILGIDVGELADVDVSRLQFDGEAVVDVSARTSWHVDELGQRHIVPAADRVVIACAFDDEIERDGAGGWRIVDRLARAKERRKSTIDAEAERQRLRWITPGAGQAMTYQAKVDEARALAVDGEEADPAHYPMLSAEIGITGATLQEVAGVVIGAYQQWQAIGAAIEAARLGGKRAVDLAESVEDVAAVTITWPDP